MAGAKERIVRPFQKAVADPLVKLAFGLGAGPPGDSLLETTSRITGRAQRSRVADLRHASPTVRRGVAREWLTRPSLSA